MSKVVLITGGSSGIGKSIGEFLTDKDFKVYGEKVIDDLKKHFENKEGYNLAPNNFEGVRVNSDKAEGWFLLRLSLHDPILPINIESNKEGGVKIMEESIRNFLSNYSELSQF